MVGWKCHRWQERGSNARGGGSNESGWEGDLHVAEDSVTLLQPVPPASVSFRPRSRSVVLNEGLRSFGSIATAFLSGLLLTRSLAELGIAPTVVVVEAHYEYGLDRSFLYPRVSGVMCCDE